jgi:hypothetical protein
LTKIPQPTVSALPLKVRRNPTGVDNILEDDGCYIRVGQEALGSACLDPHRHMINCRRWAAQYVWKPERDGIELDIPPDGLLVLNHADVILTAASSDAAPLASSRTMPAS